MTNMLSGNLIIRPISAKLTHNTEHISKMSPYVRISVGNEINQTVPAKKEHLNPTWDSELCFRLNNNDLINIEVWQKDTLSKDDLIGSATLSVSTFADKGFFSGWVPLIFKDLPAGELLLEARFFPDQGLSGQNIGMQKMSQPTSGLNYGLAQTNFTTGQTDYMGQGKSNITGVMQDPTHFDPTFKE
jgi:Ca2+-dependent lipid-binding protein